MPVVQYDLVHYQEYYIRFENDGPLITVYNSGKYIVRASSIDDIHVQDEMLLEHLRGLGVPQEVKQVSLT